MVLTDAQDRIAWLRGSKHIDNIREHTSLNMVEVNVDLIKQQLHYRTSCFPATREAWNARKKVRWMNHRLLFDNKEYFLEQTLSDFASGRPY